MRTGAKRFYAGSLLAIISLAAIDAVAQSRAPEPELYIGTVTVDALDLYAPDEAAHGVVYRIANRVHAGTRESVIRKFLLFSEGDVYRPEKLAETERNLRALEFLKSASVTAGQPHDGVVDVQVVTQDAWSLQPGTRAGSGGGTNTFGFKLEEDNLAGFGRAVSLSYDKLAERTETAIDLRDPSFFAPYLMAHVGYSSNSDGYEQLLHLNRPFISLDSSWSALATFDHVLQRRRLFSDGIEAMRFQQNHREIVAAFGRGRSVGDETAWRFTGGMRLLDDRFDHSRDGVSDPLPADRSFRYLFIRGQRVTHDYVKLNFVNSDLRYEDFNLGGDTSLEAGFSPRGLADRTTGYVRLRASNGRRIGAGGYVLPQLTAESRLDSGPQNSVVSGSIVYFLRRETAFPQTFVSRIAFNEGWRLDRDVQFLADASTGLRGYRLYSFSGSHSVVLNIEHRIYLGREVLQFASPGIAFFFDTGAAGDGSRLVRPGDLRSDVGVGLRLGLPRSPKNSLRLDFAYVLNPDPRNKRGFLVSFSSGRAF